MAKSSRRDRGKGLLDRLRGRWIEMIGKLTGRTSQQVKGKAVRKRGSARLMKGRVKRAAGRL